MTIITFICFTKVVGTPLTNDFIFALFKQKFAAYFQPITSYCTEAIKFGLPGLDDFTYLKCALKCLEGFYIIIKLEPKPSLVDFLLRVQLLVQLGKRSIKSIFQGTGSTRLLTWQIRESKFQVFCVFSTRMATKYILLAGVSSILIKSHSITVRLPPCDVTSSNRSTHTRFT